MELVKNMDKALYNLILYYYGVWKQSWDLEAKESCSRKVFLPYQRPCCPLWACFLFNIMGVILISWDNCKEVLMLFKYNALKVLVLAACVDTNVWLKNYFTIYFCLIYAFIFYITTFSKQMKIETITHTQRILLLLNTICKKETEWAV